MAIDFISAAQFPKTFEGDTSVRFFSTKLRLPPIFQYSLIEVLQAQAHQLAKKLFIFHSIIICFKHFQYSPFALSLELLLCCLLVNIYSGSDPFIHCKMYNISKVAE